MKTLTKMGIVLLTCLSVNASAQKLEFGQTVRISQPVNEDLYVAGREVTIDAPVHGDLVVAGGTVNINEEVTGDIIGAGGEINVNGVTGDDIRIAGGTVTVRRNVGGDLVATAGNLRVAKGTVVAGSLLGSGGEMFLDGDIHGYAKAAGGKLELNGKVDKTLDVRGQEVAINGTVAGPAVLSAGKLSIGNSAQFLKQVRYWSGRDNLSFHNAARGGAPIYDDSLAMETAKPLFLGFTSLMGLIWYFGAAFLFILLIQFFFGHYIQTAATDNVISRNTLGSVGFGFLFFILVPIVILLALITLIGIPLALLLMMLFITLILLSTVIFSVIFANWINIRYYHNLRFWRQAWTALGIFLLLKIISLIPIAGGLLMIAMVFLAIGSLLLDIYRHTGKAGNLKTT